MANKLISALKENKNDIRKKVFVATTITVGVIAGALIVSRLKDNSQNVLLVIPEVAEAIADAAPTE